MKKTLGTEVYVTSGLMPLVSGPASAIPFPGNELELFLGFNGETNLPVVSLLSVALSTMAEMGFGVLLTELCNGFLLFLSICKLF